MGDVQSVRDDARKSLLDHGVELLMAQIDLLKTLASIITGLSAIGYLYETNASLDHGSLVLAFIFWILTLVMSVSWTREIIDFQAKQDEEILNDMQDKVDLIQWTAIEARKHDNYKIFDDFVRQEAMPTKKKASIPSYIGETVIFLFYSSLGFLILSFLLKNYDWPCLKTLFYLLLLIFSFSLAFFDWFKALFRRLIDPVLHCIFKKE